jgi:hypothetical protein
VLFIKFYPIKTKANVDAVDRLWVMYALGEVYGYHIAGPETINLNSGKECVKLKQIKQVFVKNILI